jgi:hypothetical protein
VGKSERCFLGDLQSHRDGFQTCGPHQDVPILPRQIPTSRPKRQNENFDQRDNGGHQLKLVSFRRFKKGPQLPIVDRVSFNKVYKRSRIQPDRRAPEPGYPFHEERSRRK